MTFKALQEYDVDNVIEDIADVKMVGGSPVPISSPWNASQNVY